MISLSNTEANVVMPVKDRTFSFKEVFEAFDRWYWDKYRHHPPKMETEAFYEFLKLNGILK